MKYAPTNDADEDQQRDRRAPRQVAAFAALLVGRRRARATGGVVVEIVRLIGIEATETSSNSSRTAVMLSRPPASLAASTSCDDRLFEREGRARETRQRVAVEFVGKSVTAEQESVAGERVDRHHVDGDRLFDADAASELVATRMHRRLFGRESTHAHPLFGDAVVFGQLAQARRRAVGRPASRRRDRASASVTPSSSTVRPSAMTVVPMPKWLGFSRASFSTVMLAALIAL